MNSSSQSSEASVASSSPRYESTGASEVGQRTNANTTSTSFTFVLNNASYPHHTQPEDRVVHDRFAHTRTKRKRTSASDFNILESVYEREPRPEKELRARIASQVSLNEKEVQIWFQNRRQMTRRKARTWQPNAISEIIRSSQHPGDLTSPPLSQDSSTNSQEIHVANVNEKQDSAVNNKPAQGLFKNTSPSTFQKTATEADLTREDEEESLPETTDDTSQKTGGSSPSGDDLPADCSETPKTGASEVGDAQSQSTVETRTPAQVLKRSSSTIRLRTSLDGKAELILDKNSPSPPSKTNRRESWPARGPLRRTQSAMIPSSPSLDETSSNMPPSSDEVSLRYREILRPAGRSRDARAWQFYCDPGAKDALTIAAEHDHRGSAQAALSLIRSSAAVSNSMPGSPLYSNAQRGNRVPDSGSRGMTKPPVGEPKKSEKRKSLEKLSGSRPKLPRTTSSLARLQNSSSSLNAAGKASLLPSSQPSRSKRGKGGDLEIFRDENSDSDKENWQPGTRISMPSNPRHAQTRVNSKAVLGLNTVEISHEGSLGALMRSKNTRNSRVGRAMAGKGSSIQHSSEGAADLAAEPASRQDNGMADGDDLDAVQNLLRLSQGGRW